MSASLVKMDIRPLSDAALPDIRDLNTSADKGVRPLTSAAWLSTPQWLFVALLFAIPLLLMLAKTSAVPGAEMLGETLSLSTLPQRVQQRIDHVLFVPLAAVLVVLCRLTLGLRVLGPFRSILLAIAFQLSGILLGFVFLAGTIGVVLWVRPAITALHMPYFGRITVMLSTVSLIMVAALMGGLWLDWEALHAVAYFPIIVLCLVSDAFAKVMAREGLKSAVFRGAATVLVAVLLTLLASWPLLKSLMIHYPELLILQVGCIVVISKCLAWRLFASLNPAVGVEDDEHEFDDEFDEDGRAAAPVVQPQPAVAVARRPHENEYLAV